MPAPILLGVSDFLRLRSQGGLYVDKSHFLSSVLESGAAIQLHPRPRRFGKTLNLSSLRYFLEIGEDRSALFSDLGVWKREETRKHFQRYPVIYLSFKDIKQDSWEESLSAIRALLAEELERHQAVIEDPALVRTLRARLSAIQELKGIPTKMLKDLSLALHQHYNSLAVILIDEYDAPIINALEKGFYEKAISWFRSFFTAGLKDNDHLYKAVLTGVLRISQESLFSDLNNVAVYSLLQREIPEPFGFNDLEVEALLHLHGREAELTEFRRWYNGYRFGNETVYNPWSIVNALYRPNQPLQPWWINTSANTLVKSLLLGHSEFHQDFVSLLAGGRVEREVNEHTTLRDLQQRDVWSLLLFSGYLRADAVRYEMGSAIATLTLPNLEVSTIWTNTFLHWLQSTAGNLEPLHRAILSGEEEPIQTLLSGMLLRHVSVHDVKLTQDEAFYHAFVLGLLVSLEKTHLVKSNREEGLGRADVLILPRKPGEVGVVLEFKRQRKGRTLKSAAREALAQIRDMKYTSALEEVGATPIVRIGIAFAGKNVEVCSEVRRSA